KNDTADFGRVLEEVRLLVQKGDISAARSRAESFCQQVARETKNDPQDLSMVRSWLDATVHYAQGNLRGYGSSLAQVNSGLARFQSAVANEKFDDAEKALQELEPEASNYLLVSAAAAGKAQQVADRAWKKAVELLKAGTHDDRKLAAVLEAGNAPT